MAKAPTTVAAKEQPKSTIKEAALPAIGDTLVYHFADDVDYPILVTGLASKSFGGQVFGAGTEVHYRDGLVLGDDVGECSPK